MVCWRRRGKGIRKINPGVVQTAHILLLLWGLRTEKNEDKLVQKKKRIKPRSGGIYNTGGKKKPKHYSLCFTAERRVFSITSHFTFGR